MQQDGIATRALSVTRAYHSPFMGPPGKFYSQHLLSLKPSKGYENEALSIPMYSSVSGLQGISFREPEYWVCNLISIVDFSSAMSAALEQQAQSTARCLIIEVGPQAALRRAVEDHLKAFVGFGTNTRRRLRKTVQVRRYYSHWPAGFVDGVTTSRLMRSTMCKAATRATVCS